jgi:hypothetical protein
MIKSHKSRSCRQLEKSNLFFGLSVGCGFCLCRMALVSLDGRKAIVATATAGSSGICRLLMLPDVILRMIVIDNMGVRDRLLSVELLSHTFYDISSSSSLLSLTSSPLVSSAITSSSPSLWGDHQRLFDVDWLQLSTFDNITRKYNHQPNSSDSGDQKKKKSYFVDNTVQVSQSEKIVKDAFIIPLLNKVAKAMNPTKENKGNINTASSSSSSSSSSIEGNKGNGPISLRLSTISYAHLSLFIRSFIQLVDVIPLSLSLLTTLIFDIAIEGHNGNVITFDELEGLPQSVTSLTIRIRDPPSFFYLPPMPFLRHLTIGTSYHNKLTRTQTHCYDHNICLTPYDIVMV